MKKIMFFIIVMLFSVVLTSQNCLLVGDRDGDGLCDDIDPCPDVFNMNPVDLDGDNVYDECDNSPLFNPDQEDLDGDGIGDVSDSCIDPDRDGVCGSADRCPGSDDRIDVDNDGIPDGCDDCIDGDRDGICDDVDDCVSTNAGSTCDDGSDCTVNDRLDEFCNCIGSLRDEDGDGVCDLEDKCPGSDDLRDFDGDGVPDGCDEDENCTSCLPDEEGAIVICHIFPNGSASTFKGDCDFVGRFFNMEGDLISDIDHCGPCNCADEGDQDSDGDGICDKKDPCPNDASDSDGDGVCDSLDVCPGNDDAQDSDDDGIPDGCDELQYCAPSYDNTMEWIASINLNGSMLDNRQADDLTLHEETIVLAKGERYDLTITPEFIDNICEISIAVYVDRNSDGDFDDSGEEIYSDRSLSEIMLVMNIDDLDIGTYRMRVIMHYGRITSSCQSDIDGEIEDLLLEIIEQQPCTPLLESFDYETNQTLDDLNGGEGWNGEWQVSSAIADQVVVLEGSLNDNTVGSKIGILNNEASTVHIKREVEIDLGGSEEIYFSIEVERISGEGSLDITIGDMSIGINTLGNLYLNDAIGETLSEEVTYRLLLKSTVNLSGDDEITLTATREDGELIVLNVVDEIGDEFDAISIKTVSTNSFLPLAHFIDNIRISCEEDVFDEFRLQKIRNLKTPIHKESKDLSVALWPNPSVGLDASIIVQGEGDLFNYDLIDVAGKKIKSGAFFKGYNKLPQSNKVSGMYYLLVSDGNQVQTVRLVR